MAKSLTNGIAEAVERPAIRSRQIGVRLTESEYAALENLAWKSGRTIGDWAREQLLPHIGMGSADVANLLMTEIVGLQLFLTHVLSPIARGERITASQYEELMRQVRANKQKAAREAIAQQTSSEQE